jgi:hypothetical protein
MDMNFLVAYTTYNNAYQDWYNPATRTTVAYEVLETAETAFVEVFRTFYNGFLRYSPLVTNADLVSMGLPHRPSGELTPAPIPTTRPDTDVILSGPGVVEIHFHDETSEDKAKPAGVHGAEIVWAVLEEPPVNWAELTHSSFDTHTPFTLTFEGDQRGHRLYFALRWENTRGDKGPWSAIRDTVIP